MVLIGLFAFLKGGEPEKIGAGAYLFAWFASVMVQSNAGLGVQWAMFVIDVVMLAIFAAMVWKAPRSWPVWACALQLLTVTSHVMIMADLRTPISRFACGRQGSRWDSHRRPSSATGTVRNHVPCSARVGSTAEDGPS